MGAKRIVVKVFTARLAPLVLLNGALFSSHPVKHNVLELEKKIGNFYVRPNVSKTCSVGPFPHK
jgi:hypothetical protein